VRREVGWILAGSWLLILLLVVVPYVLLQDPFAWSASSFRLGDFSAVDAIEVSTAHSQLDDAAPMITDPERVQRVVAAVDRLATGWQIPWAGAPRHGR
jgi:hypothetical protein